MISRRLPASILACLLSCAAIAIAQEKKDQPAPRTEADILKMVKLPEGYEATVFALPPAGGYPTQVAAAIDGTIFVAIDENGSLGRDRNPNAQLNVAGPKDGRLPGKVVRMRDTDGDGRADEFKTFCTIESPRGVIWDGPGMGADGKMRGTLYVMAPPNLVAFHDADGDGTADTQEDILKGLGFGLDFRGADHTTNGCTLGIDGFIYIAVGDYGFTKAVAKDGTSLSMRGGGIVRIRPDGTGFEIVSRGQRNIYDVAVSPTLDLFTRDNTNDGGGWNVRLSHVPPGAHMGYPTLFINFPEDIIQPLADYGGGSPCGAIWLDEPGLPSGLFTVEWGRNAIMRHDLKPKGAGWELVSASTPSGKVGEKSGNAAPGQEEWIKLVRPTDMDVDAVGRLYITSWEGATFNYNGPNAGYVLRVVRQPAFPPDDLRIPKRTPQQLVEGLLSDSAVVRQAMSREIIRRTIREGGSFAKVTVEMPEYLRNHRVASALRSEEILTAFVATQAEIGRLIGSRPEWSVQGALQPGIDEYAVAALSTGAHDVKWTIETATELLRYEDARARIAAITALRRLGRADAAPSILPLVADPDPVISHLAVRALSELRASQVCLAAVDAALDAPAMGGTGVPPVGSGVPPEPAKSRLAIAEGALRALYGMPISEAVDGLIQRLARTPAAPGGTPAATGGTPVPPSHASSADLRRGILNALCRLARVDAPYLDPKEWWGTRPDTSGPVYKPEKWAESDKIEAALKREADAAKGEDARWLIQRMYLTKVTFPGLIEQMLAACGNDTPARLSAIEGLFRPDNSLPAEAVKALSEVTADTTQPPELRARALRQLSRGSTHGSVFPAATAVFASLVAGVADPGSSPAKGTPPAGVGDPGHSHPAVTAVFEDFTRDAKNAKWIGDYAKMLGAQASSLGGKQASSLQSAAGGTPTSPTDKMSVPLEQKRALAATVLVNLASSTLVKGKDKQAAEAAVEKAWAAPESAAALLSAIARTKSKAFAAKVDAHLKHPDNTVAEAALFAHQALGLGADQKPSKTVGEMKYEEVFAAVQKGGDAAAGKEIYLRAGCIACHTVGADEPPKGPILSAVAKMYDRAALTESILKPSAKLAQGFESTWIKTKKGEQLEGFVTREGGDNLDLRNIAGQTVLVEKADIAERGHREISMMPEGLMNMFSPKELADLLAYMESLKK
jgi:putative heme-binding domain-containing protein